MAPLVRPLLALALSLALVACASSGSGKGAGDALRVTFRDYRSGARLEIRSESHTDKVELYSEARSDASAKVQEDEIVAALIEYMDSKGFGENAQEGPAPREALGRYTRSFEVEQNGLVTSWAIGKSTTAERAFYECQRVFVEVYNQTLSYQTVDPEKGSLFGER